MGRPVWNQNQVNPGWVAVEVALIFRGLRVKGVITI